MQKVFLDNGGSHIKGAKLPSTKPYIAPNALARTAKNAVPPPSSKLGRSRRPPQHVAGIEITYCPDMSGMTFRRPLDRGFVTSWDTQQNIWASVFSSDVGIDVSGGRLLVTEQIGVPVHMRRGMDALVFESFSFDEYSPVSPQLLAAHAVGKQTCLVLDSGFSCTTAVPIVNGAEVLSAVRRLSVGGKTLTNLLKDTVSLRSWNMMDETAIINAVKERLCYVSMSYLSDLRATRRPGVAKEYMLPDISRGDIDPLGHIIGDDEERDGDEQVLVMNNERIAIPEMLFHPSDYGLDQAGVAEIIFQAVEACPEDVRPDLYANIMLTGGNCRFANFEERVMKELRPLVDADFDVKIAMEEDPRLTTFRGGVQAMKEEIEIKYVTKDMYEESGSDAVMRFLYGDEG